MTAYIDQIADLGACDDALAWLRAEAHPDLATAWAACPRADWLLWLSACCADAGSPEHRAVVAAAADCAEAVIDLAQPDEDRPLAAVKTARRWTRGEASEQECSAAYAAANATAYATAAAAYAAAYAARAANAAAAATQAANAAGRSVDLAAIVRRHLPAPPTLSE